MQFTKLGNVSKFVLGGAQLGKLGDLEGKALVDKAVSLGINTFDGHHRYGNCEDLLGKYTCIQKMTKISAYKIKEAENLVSESKKKLGNIHVFWISDLDNGDLYRDGVALYERYKEEFSFLGITSESPLLAMRFIREYPLCKAIMVPVYLGMDRLMGEVIKHAKNMGILVFAIKTFCDGVSLKRYGIEACVNYVKEVNPDVVVLGTSRGEHLEELLRLYKTKGDL